MEGITFTSQKVDISLDFTSYSLSGFTSICFEAKVTEISEQKPCIIPISIPIISDYSYERVTLDGTEINYRIVKVLDSGLNVDLLNEVVKNVDLITLDGLYTSNEAVRPLVLYLELSEASLDKELKEHTLTINFAYNRLDAVYNEIWFHRHWLLPFGSTKYRDYTVFSSGTSSRFWFPSLAYSRLEIASNFFYDINVSLPCKYSVVCGLILREVTQGNQTGNHLNQLNSGKQLNQLNNGNQVNRTINMKGKKSQKLQTYKFTSRGLTCNPHINRHFLGLFAGEFEFWSCGKPIEQPEVQSCDPSYSPDDDLETDQFQPDHSQSDQFQPDQYDSDDSIEDRIAVTNQPSNPVQTISRHPPQKLMGDDPTAICVTLRGFGNFLEPTNIALKTCLEVYRQECGMELPPIYLIYLPLFSPRESMSRVAALASSNYNDIKNCSCYLTSDNYLNTAFMDPLVPNYYSGTHYVSGGNIVVISMDVLHSHQDIQFNSVIAMNKRILIAAAVAELVVASGIWDPDPNSLHVSLMLQGFLVDSFIARNFGKNELKMRLFARREALATEIELYGDPYSLGVAEGVAFRVSSGIRLGKRQFWLKCQLIPTVLRTTFEGITFVQAEFWRGVMRGMAKKESLPFWDNLRAILLRRYIAWWNAKPQNRLAANQLSVDTPLDDIMGRSEHEIITSVIKYMKSFESSYIYGTGFPQVNMGILMQLQRKGTSLDQLVFRVDIKTLQPPLDIDRNGVTLHTPCTIASKGVKNLLAFYKGMRASDPFQSVLNIYTINSSVTLESESDAGQIDSLYILEDELSSGKMRRMIGPINAWYDCIEFIGRDGNFTMGFGYIGNQQLSFCLGNGPLWDSIFCNSLMSKGKDNSAQMEEDALCSNLAFESMSTHNGEAIPSVIVDSGSLYYNNGRMKIPVASLGGISYWNLINTPGQGSTEVVGRKKWLFNFKIDIVEDDGIRENVRLLGELVPIAYRVNPRSERGRKKVAVKGDKEIEEDVIGDRMSNVGDVPDYGKGSRYVGEYSQSDQLFIEWLRLLYIGIHPELSQLDNRSIVARICSKNRLPILWIRVDSKFAILARIRRCQSIGMWEQQLMSDNNIFGQYEAALALSSLYRNDNRIVFTDLGLLENLIAQMVLVVNKHRLHPAVRSRVLYTLVSIHNRDYRVQGKIASSLMDYLGSITFNSVCKQVNPSESRFILDLFQAISLLRDKNGFSPPLALDIFIRALEDMSDSAYIIKVTTVMKALGNLVIDQRGESRAKLKRLANLLWHVFRLDGIPGSCSPNREISAQFIQCLSMQGALLYTIKKSLQQELSIGLDFLCFIPLQKRGFDDPWGMLPDLIEQLIDGSELPSTSQDKIRFELGQTYNSWAVHVAAIRGQLLLLMKNEFRLVACRQDGSISLYSKPLEFEQMVEGFRHSEGLYEAVRCAIILSTLLLDWKLKLVVWRLLAELLRETIQWIPLIYYAGVGKCRDLLSRCLKFCAISPLPFFRLLYLGVREVYELMFGFGGMEEGLIAEESLQGYLRTAESGLSLPRIATFKRLHAEIEDCSTPWHEVASEAIEALKELPQAKWFLSGHSGNQLGNQSGNHSGSHSISQSGKQQGKQQSGGMWLEKMEEKLRRKAYRMPMELKVDMVKMLRGASGEQMVRDAQVVEEQWASMWPALVRVYQREAKRARMENHE